MPNFLNPQHFFFGCEKIPHPNDVLLTTGTGSVSRFGFHHKIRVLVWNVYKGKCTNWEREFSQLSKEMDLVLIQEVAYRGSHFHPEYNLDRLHWDLATSFILTGGRGHTGVATGSLVKSDGVSFQRTHSREPIAKTHKMTLFTTYQVGQRAEHLLVINIHGINFKSKKWLERQLLLIEEVIANHPGPIIFGGDFNTKTSTSLKMLIGIASRNELQQIQFPQDRRIFKFDHVFYREGTVKNAQILPHQSSSDHNPLYFEFIP